MQINLIAAYCRNRGIGYANTLPWYMKKDMIFFQQMTKQYPNNAVLMGRKTWESIFCTPLKDRFNYIVSSTITTHQENCLSLPTIHDCMYDAVVRNTKQVWIIGGHDIYEKALRSTIVDNVYITEIDKDYKCDVFFPEIPPLYKLIHCHEMFDNNDNETNNKSKVRLTFKHYSKHTHSIPDVMM